MTLPAYAPHPDWLPILAPVTKTPAFQGLLERIKAREQTGVAVYPPASYRYSALAMAPEQVRVVILGQDPYHGPGQAHGWSFSVPPDQRIPPSLANIYKEIEHEGFAPAAGRSGYLVRWHDQGVCLLNTVLTVERSQAGAHQGWGWEAFTSAILNHLAHRPQGCAFLLWGKQAQAKEPELRAPQSRVWTSAHPSPYSADRGFFGNGHFQAVNAWLVEQGRPPISW